MLFLLFLAVVGYWGYLQNSSGEFDRKLDVEVLSSLSQLQIAERNYSLEVRLHASEFHLPEEYFMALLSLECSGRKPSGSRFEPGVFRKLVALRDGRRRNFENLRAHHVKNASDEALKNLATSWGPFQLMGYKCIGLGINIHDIRGKDGVYHGMRWISKEYGHVLRERKFKDAFHLHNTGRKYPALGRPFTHDPLYVHKGMRYMKFFSKPVLEEN